MRLFLLPPPLIFFYSYDLLFAKAWKRFSAAVKHSVPVNLGKSDGGQEWQSVHTALFNLLNPPPGEQIFQRG